MPCWICLRRRGIGGLAFTVSKGEEGREEGREGGRKGGYVHKEVGDEGGREGGRGGILFSNCAE